MASRPLANLGGSIGAEGAIVKSVIPVLFTVAEAQYNP
jgi:hypothetical protein